MSEKDRTVRTTLMETFSFLPRGQVWKMLIGKSWKREREREDGPRKACPRIRRWHKRASDGVSFGSATACCNSDDDNSLPLSLFPYNKKKKKEKKERKKQKKETYKRHCLFPGKRGPSLSGSQPETNPTPPLHPSSVLSTMPKQPELYRWPFAAGSSCSCYASRPSSSSSSSLSLHSLSLSFFLFFCPPTNRVRRSIASMKTYT